MTRYYRRLAVLEKEVAVLHEQMDYIRESQRAISGLPTQVVKFMGTVDKYAEKVEGVEDDVTYLRKQIDERARERKEERARLELQRREDEKQRRAEKRSDRKWLVGTFLTTTALIIASVTFLVQNL